MINTSVAYLLMNAVFLPTFISTLYYREMGMDDAKARAFYALTNSTPFDDVRYLTRDDMARFVTLN